jgi:hypothetical protein
MEKACSRPATCRSEVTAEDRKILFKSFKESLIREAERSDFSKFLPKEQ